MKALLTLFLSAIICRNTTAQQLTVEISNPLDMPRHELVELSVRELRKQLKTDDNAKFVATNSIGQEIESQVTSDGLFLIDADVCPNGTTTYRITVGNPAKYRRWVYGRLVKERMDDFAWENDRGMYRVYGPTLQQAGEKAYGVDVWVKNTPQLLLNERYQLTMEGAERIRQLKEEGRDDEAKAMRLATSFHIDRGNGNDPYDVGPTLGCGAPALLVDGQLKMPYCFKAYRIVDDGPLRLTVVFDYDNEHRTLTVDKGSNFNRYSVTYDSLPKDAAVATGVVIHCADKSHVRLASDFVAYADPTDNIDVNNSQVYVATLFPESIDETMTMALPGQDGVRWGHALGVKHHAKAKAPFSYYFGAAWSKYDVRSWEEWNLRIKQFLQCKKQPLRIKCFFKEKLP